MEPEGFNRKPTAINSSDVSGYGRLMPDDEAAAVKPLETHKPILFDLVKQHRGRVVDSPGSNLLAEFTSVVDAVHCSVAAQKELQARNTYLGSSLFLGLFGEPPTKEVYQCRSSLNDVKPRRRGTR